MGKYIYTHREERLSDSFKNGFCYRTWSRDRTPRIYIGDECLGQKDAIVFFLDKDIPMDDDVLEALEFYTDLEGWSLNTRDRFIIARDVILEDKVPDGMSIKDSDGWSELLYIGDQARNELYSVDPI